MCIRDRLRLEASRADAARAERTTQPPPGAATAGTRKAGGGGGGGGGVGGNRGFSLANGLSALHGEVEKIFAPRKPALSGGARSEPRADAQPLARVRAHEPCVASALITAHALDALAPGTSMSAGVARVVGRWSVRRMGGNGRLGGNGDGDGDGDARRSPLATSGGAGACDAFWSGERERELELGPSGEVCPSHISAVVCFAQPGAYELILELCACEGAQTAFAGLDALAGLPACAVLRVAVADAESLCG